MLVKFCINSLFKEYGRDFFGKILVRHPCRFLYGLRNYIKLNHLEETGSANAIHPQKPSLRPWPGGREALVGLGFCLKPLEPECLSKRPNHRCYYFENHLHLEAKDKTPECCQACTIRHIGLKALYAHSSFYIMTSALDILHDIFLPAVQNQKFAYGLFGLCRYSFEPFQIGLCISQIEGSLYAYDSGDCRDYRSWRQADVGEKPEQTQLSVENYEIIGTILKQSRAAASARNTFKKKGNVFYPEFD